MKHRSENITRLTVDMTAAQRQAVDQMMVDMSDELSARLGLPMPIGVRAFFHILLKQHALDVGLDWPEDYPTPGGRREQT
jgi:hypothetical protein